MAVKIKFKKLQEDAKLPIKATEGAACFDFFVQRIEQVDDSNAILYFGLACEFPDDYVMTIQPRSSFSNKGWVQANSPGQVDSDYRGELQMRVQTSLKIKTTVKEPPKRGFWSSWFHSPEFTTYHHSLYYPELPFKVGDRCCQAKLEQVITTKFEEVEELSDTTRAGGFGSTGK